MTKSFRMLSTSIDEYESYSSLNAKIASKTPYLIPSVIREKLEKKRKEYRNSQQNNKTFADSSPIDEAAVNAERTA